MAKRKKWIKPRHRLIQAIAKIVLKPVCKIKYGITFEKFKEEENRPYLILYNHQTAFDQFFVGMSFKNPIYYLATEDIFSVIPEASFSPSSSRMIYIVAEVTSELPPDIPTMLAIPPESIVPTVSTPFKF